MGHCTGIRTVNGLMIDGVLLLIHMCCAALLHCHWQWPTATATAPLFLQHLPCINLLATSPKSTGPVQPQHNKFKRTHRERHPFCGCRTLDPGPRYPRSISASNDASMQRMLLRLKLHGECWMACVLRRCRGCCLRPRPGIVTCKPP